MVILGIKAYSNSLVVLYFPLPPSFSQGLPSLIPGPITPDAQRVLGFIGGYLFVVREADSLDISFLL